MSSRRTLFCTWNLLAPSLQLCKRRPQSFAKDDVLVRKILDEKEGLIGGDASQSVVRFIGVPFSED